MDPTKKEEITRLLREKMHPLAEAAVGTRVTINNLIVGADTNQISAVLDALFRTNKTKASG